MAAGVTFLIVLAVLEAVLEVVVTTFSQVVRWTRTSVGGLVR